MRSPNEWWPPSLTNRNSSCIYSTNHHYPSYLLKSGCNIACTINPGKQALYYMCKYFPNDTLYFKTADAMNVLFFSVTGIPYMAHCGPDWNMF